MATVIKANYKTSRGSARAKSGMSSLRYFSQRPDFEGNQGNREIISPDGRLRIGEGQDENRKALEERFENDRREYLYRMVMSSGDKQMTARETEQWARNTLEKNGLNDYLMVVHADDGRHTSNPHVHVLVSTDQKLNVKDFERLRETGDREHEVVQSLRVAPPLYRDIDDTETSSKKGGGRHAEQEQSEPESRRKVVDIQFGQ